MCDHADIKTLGARHTEEIILGDLSAVCERDCYHSISFPRILPVTAGELREICGRIGDNKAPALDGNRANIGVAEGSKKKEQGWD